MTEINPLNPMKDNMDDLFSEVYAQVDLLKEQNVEYFSIDIKNNKVVLRFDNGMEFASPINKEE